MDGEKNCWLFVFKDASSSEKERCIYNQINESFYAIEFYHDSTITFDAKTHLP